MEPSQLIRYANQLTGFYMIETLVVRGLIQIFPCLKFQFLKFLLIIFSIYRSSHPVVFLGRAVLKIYSRLTGEHPCQSVISIKLLCNFIEITLRHSVLLQVCCIFSEHLFLGTPLDDCFSI